MNLRRSAFTAGYLALWRTVSLMPEGLAYRTMESLFAREYRGNGRRVARLRETFAPIVEPHDLERTVEETFRWYGRYFAEMFRLPLMSSKELDARFSIDGRENLQQAHDSGEGAVLATLHMGNWDAGGRWVSERWPMTAVAEVLEPRAVFERFLRYRRRLGMGIVPLEKGRDVTAECAVLLGKGELVALLSDRDLSGHGVAVDFFGRRASMAAGPAVLAARTGCRVLPAVVLQSEVGRHHIVVDPPLPETPDDSATSITATTQRIAEAYERFIRRAPAQWHMFQRFWPDRAELKQAKAAE